MRKVAIAHPSGPVVLLGASYAEGWTLGDIGGIPVVNRGVAGQQSFDLLERFERDVVAARPRAVIIWGFINDLFRSSPEDHDRTFARVRASYTKMVQLAVLNGIESILATEVTVRPKNGWRERVAALAGAMVGKKSYQDRINQQVISINRWLTADLGRLYHLAVLDLHSASSERNGRRRQEFIDADGSHITPAGYAALAAYARPILESHIALTDGS